MLKVLVPLTAMLAARNEQIRDASGPIVTVPAEIVRSKAAATLGVQVIVPAPVFVQRARARDIFKIAPREKSP